MPRNRRGVALAAFGRGVVVWHPAPFRDGGRPFVVPSDDDHRFYGGEYVVVGVPTTERDRAVAVPPETWKEGQPPNPSWASPGSVLTGKHANISDEGLTGGDVVRAVDQIDRGLLSVTDALISVTD